MQPLTVPAGQLSIDFAGYSTWSRNFSGRIAEKIRLCKVPGHRKGLPTKYLLNFLACIVPEIKGATPVDLTAYTKPQISCYSVGVRDGALSIASQGRQIIAPAAKASATIAS